MKVLALDYGSARTGVAVSDPTGTARPAARRRRAASATPRRVRAAARGDPRGGARGDRRRAAAHAARRARRAGARDGRVRRVAAGARSTIPVETYDERFTSVLAGGDDARAAAHLLASYLEWRSPDPLSAQIRRRRIVAVLAFAVVVALAVGVAVGAVRRTAKPAPTTAAAAPPPPPKPFRIVFPEGFTRAADGRPRQGRRRRSPSRSATRRVRLDEPAYLAALAQRRRAVLRPQRADEPRGLPLPGDLRLPERDDVAPARARPDRGVLPQLAEGRPRATRARRT